MGILSWIASQFGGQIVDKLLGNFVTLFTAYINKTITLEELRAKMIAQLLVCFADVEKANVNALTQTYASFAQALVSSKIVQYTWATVLVVQLLVLTWAQVGIPFMVYHYGGAYPSSGATLDYAYFLILALTGCGPLLFKTKVADYKSLISK